MNSSRVSGIGYRVSRTKTWTAIFGAVVLCLLVAGSGTAAEKTFLNRLFFDDFVCIGRTIAENPVQSSIIAGSTLLAGWIIYANDKRIADEMKIYRGDVFDVILDTANIGGDGVTMMAANSLLFLGGAREKKAARLSLESILISGVIVNVIKTALGRLRPWDSRDPYMFKPFSFSNLSMPSGHSSTAFSWATIIGDTYDIGYITYPVAALVAWARVYRSAHWPSDVLIGGVLGTVTAKILISEPEDETTGYAVKITDFGTPMLCLNIKM